MVSRVAPRMCGYGRDSRHGLGHLHRAEEINDGFNKVWVSACSVNRKVLWVIHAPLSERDVIPWDNMYACKMCYPSGYPT